MALRHRKPSKEDPTRSLRKRENEEYNEGSADKVVDNVNDSSTQHTCVTPLRQRPPWMRLDVLPFLLVYLALVTMDQTMPDHRFFLTIGLSLAAILHISVVLAATWSVRVRCVVGYQVSPKNAPNSWTHALVQNLQDDQIGITELESNSDLLPGMITCKFHESVFVCDTRARDLDRAVWSKSSDDRGLSAMCKTSSSSALPSFRPRFYPTNLPLTFYSSWTGHSPLSLTLAESMYGPNTCALQPPSFFELLSQQLVAPLFLFQLLCIGLWCLDEYWYYAIYTLLALLMFEGTVAYQRQSSLQKLQRAGNQGKQRVYVRRPVAVATGNTGSAKLQWAHVRTSELVPGDVVSLSCNYTHSTTVVPADILLTRGTAVCDESLLTGESVPQLKHALETARVASDQNHGRPNESLDIADKEHRESVLFGGTVLIATAFNESSVSLSESQNGNAPPDRGVVGIVLRTGFETTQGSLLRSMAYSSKYGSSGTHSTNLDTFIFILLLLCCAIVAAGLVLRTGWEDERRNRYRLFLHVVMIITSVVPPELPMELSLAVTNSVGALMHRCRVYCTEIFRIPWAGEVDVCCFDKTGTLTSDEMQLKGVCLSNEAGDLVKKDLVLPSLGGGIDFIPDQTLIVMAACHSLAIMRSGGYGSTVELVGDPLEQTVLKETGYQMINNDTVASVDVLSGRATRSFQILHRYAFSSKLKRMTVLAAENEGQGKVLALSKGAPETIRGMLKFIPAEFDETARFHMQRGRRVLAMACAEVGNLKDLRVLKQKGREAFERNLVFAGFLVLDCPLKTDSKSVITELRKSGHTVLMCTGDALFTAVEVARQVSIVKKKHKVYELRKRRNETTENSSDPLAAFELHALDENTVEKTTIPISHDKIRELTRMREEVSFCVTGDVLVEVAAAAVALKPIKGYTLDEKHILLHPEAQLKLAELVPLISVFARHAPHQKEAVIAAFNRKGYCTLMCGDGTNDVGALKRARVGISLVSAPEIESKQRRASEAISRTKDSKKASSRQRMDAKDPLRQLHEAEAQLDQVELGDASVAAPFTSKAVSIKCCKDVIQQGRCTLVTMLSIYKILGVNCLVNAMVLSKLFLNGVKQGDRQMTILGVVITALFYFVTRADPLPTLSNVRPPASIMCARALMSIVLQCIVHCTCILLVTDVAMAFVDPFDPSLVPDGAFNANPLNTTTFLFTCLATVNTFAVNYRGRPFMADLKENKLFYRSLQICFATLFILVSECFPPLNDLFQLSPMPTVASDGAGASPGVWQRLVLDFGFPVFFCGLMVLDTVLVLAVERMLR